MHMTITSVDYAPDELYEQVPLELELLRPLQDASGIGYWIGHLKRPVRWVVDGFEREITHLAVQARWVGDHIRAGARDMPVNIVFVIDNSMLQDAEIGGSKGEFVAIGVCNVVG
jgi:hypothetical protein